MNQINTIAKLKKFIIEKAEFCVHEPAGKLAYQYVTPTYGVKPGEDDLSLVSERSLTGHYLQMYDWDACFFSQAAFRLGLNGFAQSVVSNFLSLREADGYVPRTISPQRTWDQGDICKPFLAQALIAGKADNKALPPKLINDLNDYLRYYRTRRLTEQGLYHWRNVLESGIDNNFTLLAPHEASKDENENNPKFPDNILLASDLNAYLANEFAAFSKLAKAVGNTGFELEYAKLAAELKENIEEKLWNPRLGLYCNLNPESKEQVEIRSWSGLAPALFDACSPEKAEEVIKRNILASEHFLRPHGLASTAASERLYNQAKRGLYGRAIVSNWQGPVWVLPNALVNRCLVKYGYMKEAEDLAWRVISTMANALAETGTLFENYNAETGEPLWAPQFISWNILTLELIEILE